MWNSVPEYKRYKLAILWSGGLDSTLAIKWALCSFDSSEIALVTANYGQPYFAKERSAISKCLEAYPEIDRSIHRDLFNTNLCTLERGNVPTLDRQIVPGRNLLLAFYGATVAEAVWICALDGEMHVGMPDKNDAFFSMASTMLSHVFPPSVLVRTPFSGLTKAELIKWALGRGVTVEQLDATMTCYDPNAWVCNRCTACYKRWIAYRLNDLSWPHKHRPSSPTIEALMQRMFVAATDEDYSHYSKRRLDETLDALAD